MYMLVDIFSGLIVPLAIVILYCVIKKVNVKKSVLLILFSIYVVAVLDVVGVPYIQTAHWNPVLNLVPFSDLVKNGKTSLNVFQFTANIIMLVPFGFFVPLIWKSLRKLYATAVAGFLFSLGIEAAQLFSPRVTASDDVILNTLGALVGYVVAAVIFHRSWKKEARVTKQTRSRDYVELAVLILLALVTTVLFKYAIGSWLYSTPLFK